MYKYVWLWLPWQRMRYCKYHTQNNPILMLKVHKWDVDERLRWLPWQRKFISIYISFTKCLVLDHERMPGRKSSRVRVVRAAYRGSTGDNRLCHRAQMVCIIAHASYCCVSTRLVHLQATVIELLFLHKTIFSLKRCCFLSRRSRFTKEGG